MKEVLIQMLKNIYLNQNFIWLIFLYIGVWFADKHNAFCLCKVTMIMLIIVCVSVASSAIVYAYEYWANRIFKIKCYNLRYKYRCDATISNPPACTCIEKIKAIDNLLKIEKK